MMSIILRTCATFSMWIDLVFSSFLLFGEYPYPSEEDYE